MYLRWLFTAITDASFVKIKKINKTVDSKNTTAYNTHINDNKIKLINNSQYYKSINKTKIFSIDKKEDKHSDNLFLTDFRTTKHSDLSKSRNQFPRLQLDSNLITAYNSNTIFLKSFSSVVFFNWLSNVFCSAIRSVRTSENFWLFIVCNYNYSLDNIFNNLNLNLNYYK